MGSNSKAESEGRYMDEKEYIVELRVTVDKEELEANGGNIADMIYNATMEAPFSFSIEDCREINY